MQARSFLPRVLLLLLAVAARHGGASSSSAPSQNEAAAAAAAEDDVDVSAGAASAAADDAADADDEDDAGPPPRVIELDAMNFDSSIRDGNVWLVEFYAPWCGHCKRFAATYEEVAKKLHKGLPPGEGRVDGKRVMVAKVDGAADRALSARFSVHAFPTFYLVDGWNVYLYDGRRTLDDLVDFAVEDYADHEPIPFLNSPFGPMGQIRAAMMYAGTRAIVGHEALVDRGYSRTAAAAMLCAAGIFAGLVAIIAVGLCMVPKPKED